MLQMKEQTLIQIIQTKNLISEYYDQLYEDKFEKKDGK